MAPSISELAEGGLFGRSLVPDGGPDLRVPAEPGGGAHQVGLLRRRLLRLPRQLILLHQQHVGEILIPGV